ncbi:hypothetical protein HDU97_003713 [Phlyctochytrium planicorne]|nr:hypothetical protein HDU97_003713 [Phlyctochytrium planicorne]
MLAMKFVSIIRCSPRRPWVRALHAQTPVTLHDTFLEVALPSSSPTPSTRFHYKWLRHNCGCQTDSPDSCRHPKTGERVIDSIDLLPVIRPVKVHAVSDQKDNLRIEWNDGHVSSFNRIWLEENAYDRPVGTAGTISDVEKESGSSKIIGDVKVEPANVEDLFIDFPQLLGKYGISSSVEGRTENADRSAWGLEYRRLLMDRLDRFGAVVVKARGLDTEVILNDFLPAGKDVIHTHFGRIEDLRTDNTTNSNTDQLGYTDAAVEVHTDQPFIPNPPGFQMLHCIRPAPNLIVDGRSRSGESLLVDMKRVSDYLRENRREDWALLTTVKVAFDRRQKKFRSLQVKPILEVDEDGELKQVRYSYFTHAPFTNVPFESMTRWYAAYDTLAHLVRDPASPFRMEFRLARGDLILYSNHRMLHGRMAFNGNRHMRGVYYDTDDVWNRLKGADKMSP